MKLKSETLKGRTLGLLTSCSLITITAGGIVPAATAQDASTSNELIEEVVVTGSRRKGRSIEDSTVPIDVLSGSDLTSTGIVETNQLLNNLLPSFNFPLPSVTDGTDVVRPAQLRGLAPDQTLVLVNGKRRHASALLNLNGSVGRGSNAVDLNNIPANAISRIEVLRDGASAQYGSDAIAGVINVVLKNNPEGLSFSAIYGQHVTTLDGVPELERTTIDANGDLQFQTSEDDSRADGETITFRGNIGLPIADGFFNLSAEYRDRNPTNRSGFDPRQQFPTQADGSLDIRETTFDRVNHRFGNADVQDISVVFNAAVPINETWEVYSFGSYNNREGESGGFYRRAQDSRNVLEIYPDGFLPLITSDINDVSIAAGVRGNIAGWDTDLSFVYGENDFDFGVENSLNTSLGPNSQTEFFAGSLINDQFVVNLDFSKLLEIAERPVNVAFGFEYRDDGYEIVAGEEASFIRGPFGRGGAVRVNDDDPFGAAGAQVFPGFTPASEVNGSRDNVSVYLELDGDVTDKLNIAVAGRFEDFSDFGSTVNGKIAARYEVTPEFAVRGSVSTGFRAPSLAQQFFTSVATVFVDGVPTETGTFRPDSDVARALGSPGLEEETSVSFTAGFTWTPIDGLTLTADYFNIQIDDRIILSENLSGDGVEQLLAGTGANRARFFLNGIDSGTQGIDIVASYNFDLNEYGDLNINAGFNYTDNEVQNVLAPPTELQQVGVTQANLFARREIERFEDGAPSTKLNIGATWRYDGLHVTARTNRFGETIDPSNDPAQDEILDAEWITDLEVGYDFNENVTISIGGNNIFDVYPQATADFRAQAGLSAGSTFNRIFPYSGFSPFGFNGRYLYARIDVNF